jgi:hypothetical protein
MELTASRGCPSYTSPKHTHERHQCPPATESIHRVGRPSPARPTGSTGGRNWGSGDGGDVPVIEIDGLVQPPTQGSRVAGDDLLAGQLALFDLGDAALADPHPLGHLLSQAAGPAHLGQTVADCNRQQLLHAGRHRLVVPIRLPGAVFRGYRHGWHLAPDHIVGHITFDEFLQA